MTTTKILPVFFFLCGWLLTSCGGSTNVAGIGGTGITTTGTITGFGSIIVNGIRFETDTAQSIIVDDMSFDDQSALGLGMVVTVTGTVNDDGVNGNADTIFYDDEIEGPVSGLSSNMSTLSFTILGQAVTASANPSETVFEDTSFTDLVDNDFVEVSGFVDNSVSPPVIRATRIEKKGDSSTTSMVEIEGAVSNLDDVNKTFVIVVIDDPITVDYTIASFEDMTENDLANDLFVEVAGDYDMANNLITATRIEREENNSGSGSGSDPDEGSKVSLEGIVSEFDGIDSFVVLGQQVDATNAEFKPESLQDSLDNGVLVEVEGIIENGILVADEVETE